MPPLFYGLCRRRTAKSGRKTAAFPRELTGLRRRGTLRPERGIRGADGMADSQNSVGEVRVKPDRILRVSVSDLIMGPAPVASPGEPKKA